MASRYFLIHADIEAGIANGKFAIAEIPVTLAGTTFANANAQVPLANVIVVNADTAATYARRPRCLTLSARRVQQGLYWYIMRSVRFLDG